MERRANQVKTIRCWKENHSLPKDEFPTLLNTVLRGLEHKMAKNLKAGFKNAGMFPLNRGKLLNRLPKRIGR